MSSDCGHVISLPAQRRTLVLGGQCHVARQMHCGPSKRGRQFAEFLRPLRMKSPLAHGRQSRSVGLSSRHLQACMAIADCLANAGPAATRADPAARAQVVIADCFRPGDLVRAEVVSLGTQRDYFLGTARNELGVIWARSRAGAAMAAVSWTQMRCPNTGQVEARKVARVTAA